MNLNCRLWHWKFLAVFIVGLASGEVSAQVVTVAFSAVGAEPVPISFGAIALLSMILLLTAWWILRRRISGRHWTLLLFASVIALSYTESSKPWLSQASAAAPVTSFNLVFPSPTTSPILAIYTKISVINTTGKTIILDAIDPPESDLELVGTSTAPTCQVGLVLPPNAVCYFILYLLDFS